MKDAEPATNILSPADEAEKFQLKFSKHQQDLLQKIDSSNSIPADELLVHFAALDKSLQWLENLYSNSSPYLRIYDRRIFQNSLQDLQAKIVEKKDQLLPRKKFSFKTKKGKTDAKQNEHGGSPVTFVSANEFPDSVDGLGSCVVRGRDHEVVSLSSEATGKTVVLTNLDECRVEVLGAPNTVYISDVKNCVISIGPVATSIFVEAAESCRFQLACQQLRIHKTVNSDFFIHVTSKAIIEECRKVRFGTYSFKYGSLDEDYIRANLNREINNWRDIDDFDWLVSGQPSPNWSIHDESATR